MFAFVATYRAMGRLPNFTVWRGLYSLNKMKVPGVFQFIRRNKNFILCVNETSLKDRKTQFLVMKNTTAVAFPTTWVEEALTDEKSVLTGEEKAEVDWFLYRKPVPLEFLRLPQLAGLDFFSEEAPEILKQGKDFFITQAGRTAGYPSPFDLVSSLMQLS